VLASLGLLGTAFAQTYNDLILWRLLSAIGYGLAFVACQGYVIDHTDRTNRARGLAMFTGGIIAADICGPAIGGILANHLGFRATLAIAGATALIAVVAVWWLMDTHRRRARPVQPSFPGALRDLSRSWRFLVLIVFAALPAKFVLAGFLFFQVPLFLTELGASQSEIGRILMLYGITAFVTTPVFAHWADRFEAHGFLVGLGGAVAGLGLLPILLDASVAQIVLAVTLLGLGQAMTLSSLIAVLTRIAHDDIERRGQASILGVFRLLERIGAALGPLCVAWLVAEHGHVAAMAFTGVLVFAGAILFSSLMLMGGYEPVPGADPDLSSDGLS
jgi:predicted MFS family arabinose efflux permease